MVQKDMLIEEFGRFGLFAQRVAQKSFRAQMNDSELMHVTSVRAPVELLTRIEAFAQVGGVSRNRLMCELLQESVDELESTMQDENMQGFEDYLHTYERICELSMDARD